MGELTAAQRSLLDAIQKHGFGRIENMTVEAGQPLLDRGVRIVRIARLDRDAQVNAPDRDDFNLKQPFRKLFAELMQLQDCFVVRLEFRWGLPLQLETALDDQGYIGDPTLVRSTRSSRRSSSPHIR